MWPWSTIKQLKLALECERDIVTAQRDTLTRQTRELESTRTEFRSLREQRDDAQRKSIERLSLLEKARTERDAYKAGAENLSALNREVIGQREALKEQLAVASKNDARDAKGRFTKAGG